MARYTGPITKKSRRLKTDLVGGDKNYDLRPFPPGQHGRRRIQEKEYLTQLQEKQKARFTYGVMEKQFRRYYKEAANRPGKTGENILTILESRLDNVIYRAGLARTRRQARQLVSHGHFEVNGVRVDVPSYRVEQYDIITVRKQSVEAFPIQLARETYGDRPTPAWLQVVPGTLQVLVHQLPTRAQMLHLPTMLLGCIVGGAILTLMFYFNFSSVVSIGTENLMAMMAFSPATTWIFQEIGVLLGWIDVQRPDANIVAAIALCIADVLLIFWADVRARNSSLSSG